MGGIVARHAVTRLGQALVPAIITMSTPHLIPPMTFERGMQDVYNEIDAFWRNTAETDTVYSVPPVLISICGGTADTQISSDSCALQSITRPSVSDETALSDSVDEGTLAVFTTGMEGVWTGVDHQAMVWCDQVRRVVATTLLDMSASLHDNVDDHRRLHRKLIQTARRRLSGERMEEELQGKVSTQQRVSTAKHESLTPKHSTFRDDGSGYSAFTLDVPRNASRFQIIGNTRMNGVGRKGGAAVTLHLGSADGISLVQHGMMALTTLRILPQSSGLGDKAAQRESFPVQGEGVKDEEVLTYAEAEFGPADHTRKIVLQMAGPGWGTVALLAGDSGVGKCSKNE